MANTGDLRFVRTEAAIREAFMGLVAHASVSTITASAVCRQAGISRNAFYLHHASVSELYAAMVGELVADVRTQSIASARRVQAMGDVDRHLPAAILDTFSRHEELLRALLPADNGSLAKQLAEGIEEAYVEAALLLGEQGGSFAHRMSCAFAAWAHVGLVVRWIGETERPLAEAVPLFERFQQGLSESATRYLMESPEEV